MLAIRNGPNILATSAAAEASAVVLPVEWQGQPPGSEWCWAACCAMILTANGTPTTVDRAAELVLGPMPDTQAQEYPGHALTAVGLLWETQPHGVGAPLTEESMRQWIVDGRRPIEIYWLYDETGHVGLVTGYDGANGKWRLLDPLQDSGWVTYEYLQAYNGQGMWDNTFYAIGNAL